MPVWFGAGIGWYFALSFEPNAFWLMPCILFMVTCTWCLRTKFRKIKFLLFAFLSILSGFAAADFRTTQVAAPAISGFIRSALVEATVQEVELQEFGARYLLSDLNIQGVSINHSPKKIRLVWRGDLPTIVAGDRVRTRAYISAPPEPVMAGGYDYARQLYFEQIGGVGYMTKAPQYINSSSHDRSEPQREIENWRGSLSDRIRNALKNVDAKTVNVCVALITGKREAIDQSAEQALRDAGLAHLLAISGLHIGMIAGLVFFFTRWLMSLSERLALKYPIKKIAAIFAILAAFAYFLLSGAGWSTRRAFIMAFIMFAAVIMERRALSLRNVAIAALFILVWTPEALFQAGFQMSFAAVIVLIAGYEYWREKEQQHKLNRLRTNKLSSRVLMYFSALTMTSVLAGFATLPFALMHFNRMAVYGLAGNLLAMPIMGILIMPSVILAFVLMPFNLDYIAWRLMAYGVEAVINIAGWVAEWDGAVKLVPQLSYQSFILIIAAGLLLCFGRSPLRLTGIAVVVLSVWGQIAARDQPSVLIGRDARLIGIVHNANQSTTLLVDDVGRERFTIENWSQSLGISYPSEFVQHLNTVQDPHVHCNQNLCEVQLRSTKVVRVMGNNLILKEDCLEVDVILTRHSVKGEVTKNCAAKIIDASFVKLHGPTAIYIKDQQLKFRTSRSERGQRPWVHTAN